MSKVTPLAVDVERAIDLLAQGRSADEVRALCPNVDPDDPHLLALAAWRRDAAAGASRLDDAYLVVRMMGLVDQPAGETCKHCGHTPYALDPETRGKLLTQLARIKRHKTS